MLSFEDKILIKLTKLLKIFWQKTDIKFLTKLFFKKLKKMNIRQLSVKVANNRFDRTHCRERSATVVSKCVVFIR